MLQKSSGTSSEETVLVKAFKYFDTDGSGECSPDEFKKALEKIGITFPNDKELKEIFNLYDAN